MTALPTAGAPADLDDLLEPCYEADDPFAWWGAGRDEWWAQLAEACLPPLLAASPLVRAMAAAPAAGPELGRLTGPAAPYRDLLVPSAVFKRGLAMSEAPDAVDCTSSGTRGSVSMVPRDDATLQRFFSGVRAAVRALVEMGTNGFDIVSLLPSLSSPQAPWTSYIVAGMATAHPTVEPGPKPARDLLAEAAWANERCMVVGAPHDVLAFAEEVGGRGPWSDRLVVVTVGGWKSREREALAPAALRSRVGDLLGMPTGDIRDGYSMVEINTVLIECAEHRKHVPPWLEVLAVSPRRFEPVPDGTPGMLAFFDPTATSFPSFVLSEDVGVRHGDACPCGLAGPTLTEVRRLALVEARGCALTSSPRAARRGFARLA